MTSPLRIVVFGLSLSSSWGNGHATTWRALLKGMAARGHDILFLERDVPWYAAHRDLTATDYCRLEFYDSLPALEAYIEDIQQADAVIVGSFVPEGIALGRWLQRVAPERVTFYDIDTPVTLAQLERGTSESLSADLIPGYRMYFSFTGGPLLRRLEKTYGAPAARALYCSVDTDIYRPIPQEKRWDLGYLGTYSADRQPGLERLLIEPARRAPELRFVVAGAQYPDDIDWPANVERIAHVPPQQHPAFYCACRYALNLTRSDMIAVGYAPSVRLFEAAACGTPIISDRWAGIETLFAPDRQIILADTTGQVLDALLHRSEIHRRAMAEAAYGEVLEQHSARQRAAELEALLLSISSIAPQANNA